MGRELQKFLAEDEQVPGRRNIGLAKTKVIFVNGPPSGVVTDCP